MDLTTEKLLSLEQAAARAPKGRGSVSLKTVQRWVRKGLNGVRLETVSIGGANGTTAEALNRFFAAVTEARRGHGRRRH